MYDVYGFLNTKTFQQGNPLNSYTGAYSTTSSDFIDQETEFTYYHDLGIADKSRVKYILVEMSTNTYEIRVARSGDSQYAYMPSYTIGGPVTYAGSTQCSTREFQHYYGNNVAHISITLSSNEMHIRLSGDHNYLSFRELPILKVAIIYEG